MRHRIVYDNEKIIECVADDSNTVTSSLKDFLLDSPQKAGLILYKQGIDVSFLWKNGFINPVTVFDPMIEVDISNHPEYNTLTRKAFVLSLNFDTITGEIRFTILIKHFYQGIEINGNVNEIIDDLPQSIRNLNLEFYDEMYLDTISSNFLAVLEDNTSILDRMKARINDLDNSGKLDTVYGV